MATPGDPERFFRDLDAGVPAPEAAARSGPEFLPD